MTSSGVVQGLAEFFLPIGVFGAGFAAVCAIVAGMALVQGRAGLCGGAVGMWIVGAMLSVSSGFSGEWTPLLTAVVALAVALAVGGGIRAVVVGRRPERTLLSLP